MKNTLLAASALLLVAGSAFAAPPVAKKAPAKPAAKKVAAFPTVCPVTGEKIASVKDAAGGSSVYNGKTYYFCCAGCKPAFDKEPAKFAKAEKAPMTHGDIHKGM